MIPKSVTKKHVLSALEELDKNGWPKNREAKLFKLVHNGKSYPPKYLVAVAAKLATGQELDPEHHSGGIESNTFLTKLGFTLQTIATSASAPTRKRKPASSRNKINPGRKPATAARTSNLASQKRHYRIGRVTLKGNWFGEVSKAGEVLDAIIRELKGKVTFDYLSTPGGFIQFPWINGLRVKNPPAGDDNAHRRLWEYLGNTEILELLYDEKLEQLSEIAGAMTLGFDSITDDETYQGCSAEYVLFIPLPEGEWQWTGKSYPAPHQKKTLLRVTELESHFIKHKKDRVMLLGCHDLNLFSPRARASARTWKQQTIQDFERVAKEFAPNIVLQHPHTTDTPGIWRMGWTGLRKSLPTVAHWVGTGKYVNHLGDSCRSTLEKSLASTASAEVLSMVFDTENLNAPIQIIESQ